MKIAHFEIFKKGNPTGECLEVIVKDIEEAKEIGRLRGFVLNLKRVDEKEEVMIKYYKTFSEAQVHTRAGEVIMFEWDKGFYIIKPKKIKLPWWKFWW